MRGRWTITTTASLAGLLLACGGGGGGGPTTPPPQPSPTPPPANIIMFNASGGTPANSLSLRSGSGTSAQNLELVLDATGVIDLYTLGYDLVYPSNLLRFVDIEEGGFLDGGGATQTSLQVADDGAGRMVVGLSRLGNSGGRDGSGAVLTMRFAKVAGGSGAIRFENEKAFEPDGDPIGALQWVDGTVQVPN